jgi:NTP pyrophosphatase (non-canonical NTP hydrolase)
MTNEELDEARERMATRCDEDGFPEVAQAYRRGDRDEFLRDDIEAYLAGAAASADREEILEARVAELEADAPLSLSFAKLRCANVQRNQQWTGGVAAGLSFRGLELGGEVGEALNVAKKLERERLGWRGSRSTLDKLAEELADVIISADSMAMEAGINLAEAVVRKFNATSVANGFPQRLNDVGEAEARALLKEDEILRRVG